MAAPAGYGKSTLVSDWLGAGEEPSAWLSVDEMDSDVRVFMAHLVAAVRTIFPGACPQTEARLRGVDLPSPSHLSRCLGNEVEALDERFVLVLDDYHLLRQAAIHELLDDLLQHPPAPLHLVIITRRNPPLSLERMRANGMLNEIRMRDLQFLGSETTSFLERALKKELHESTPARLQEVTEGWPVGLRLAALALSQVDDEEELLRGFSVGPRSHRRVPGGRGTRAPVDRRAGRPAEALDSRSILRAAR